MCVFMLGMYVSISIGILYSPWIRELLSFPNNQKEGSSIYPPLLKFP